MVGEGYPISPDLNERIPEAGRQEFVRYLREGTSDDTFELDATESPIVTDRPATASPDHTERLFDEELGE